MQPQSIIHDLHFMLFAPELMQHDFALHIEHTPERKLWLHKLAQQPEKLAAINSQQPLGRYYESLWAFFFKEDEQFELIAENLVLQGHSKTLGEFDFIVFDKHSQQYYHLEIAIKYYLFFNSHPSLTEAEQSHWLGPNSQDNLHKKWQHLINKQSQLSRLPEAKVLLESLGIPYNQLIRKISAKGYLFHPQSQLGQLPKLANPQALSAYYFIDDLEAVADKALYLIPKHRWLSQGHHCNDVTAISVEELNALLETKQSPLLFAYGELVSESDGELIFNERQRFFVCPKFWPYCLLKPYRSIK